MPLQGQAVPAPPAPPGPGPYMPPDPKSMDVGNCPAAQPMGIPLGLRLDVREPSGQSETVELTSLNGSEVTVFIAPGACMSFDGRVFGSAEFATGGGAFAYVPFDAQPTFPPSSLATFQNSGQLTVLMDQTGTLAFPRQFTPATGGSTSVGGMWRGFARAAAAGAVSIQIAGVGTFFLGTAADATTSFPFTCFYVAGAAVTLTNCTIVAAGLSV